MKTTRRNLFLMAAGVPLVAHAHPLKRIAPPMRPWQAGIQRLAGLRLHAADLMRYLAIRFGVMPSLCAANLYHLRENSPEGYYFASLYGDSESDAWFLHELLFEPRDATKRLDCEVYWQAEELPRDQQTKALVIGLNETR